MAYKAFAVAGTKLQMSTASPVSYTTIRGVEGFQGPTATKPDIDVTAIDDTSAQFLAGIPDYGTVSWDMFWDPTEANHAALKDAFDTVGSVTYFKILNPNLSASFQTFSGEVKGFEWDYSKGGAVKVKVSVKLSGSVGIDV